MKLAVGTDHVYFSSMDVKRFDSTGDNSNQFTSIQLNLNQFDSI
jgi:hypothetical protein